MRSIARLFAAFGTLADSVLSLAGVIDAAAGRLRQQLDGDAAPIAEAVLDHRPVNDSAEHAGVNGKGRKARARA
jgi:hypothetical protein